VPKEDAIYFPDAAALRAWFVEHAATAEELFVGYSKRHTGKPSPTWSESVDEALCFGWIDGVRHSVDADRYTNRFTPRRKGSNWSLINIKKVEALTAAGRMTPAGLAAFASRKPEKTGRTSYEQRPDAFPPEHLAVFRRSKAAWAWFAAQPPGYQRLAIWYVVSAVRPETQAKRLAAVIAASAERKRIIGPTGVAAKPPAAAKTARPSAAPRSRPRSRR
jgi:uncharacterized protein YdeI (YjbR/CyaY-like superfamily)